MCCFFSFLPLSPYENAIASSGGLIRHFGGFSEHKPLGQVRFDYSMVMSGSGWLQGCVVKECRPYMVVIVDGGL